MVLYYIDFMHVSCVIYLMKIEKLYWRVAMVSERNLENKFFSRSGNVFDGRGN